MDTAPKISFRDLITGSVITLPAGAGARPACKWTLHETQMFYEDGTVYLFRDKCFSLLSSS